MPNTGSFFPYKKFRLLLQYSSDLFHLMIPRVQTSCTPYPAVVAQRLTHFAFFRLHFWGSIHPFCEQSLPLTVKTEE